MQMKKRRRAEIFNSYIKMGQAVMDVDPELYQIVRDNHLRNRHLCGRHAQDSPLLPPQSERRTRRVRLPQYKIDDSIIDTIISRRSPRRKPIGTGTSCGGEAMTRRGKLGDYLDEEPQGILWRAGSRPTA